MNILEGLRRVYIVVSIPIVFGMGIYWWGEAAVRPYPFDVAAAKAEGYQEWEVADYLVRSYGKNLEDVRALGFTDAGAIDTLLKLQYQAVGKTYRQEGEQWLREIPRKKTTIPKQAVWAAGAATATAFVLFVLWVIFQWIFVGFFPSFGRKK